MDKSLHLLTERKGPYEDLFYFMQEAAVIGTWEYFVQTNHLEWSEITKKIHEVPVDYKPTVETGLSFYKKGMNVEIIKNRFSNALEKGDNFDEELQIITAKNNRKWVRSIGYPIIKNGVCVKVYGLFQDITNKTNAARKIAIREEQFRASFDEAAAAMAIINLKGNWTKVNLAMCNMLGYAEEELLKIPQDKIVSEKILKKDKATFEKLLSSEIKNYTYKKKYRHKEGYEIWCLVSISLIKNDVGEPIHFLTQNINITKSKKSEDEINRLLKTTKQQNNRLLNFAHIVSHNLRSHSSNFSMLLEMMNEEFPVVSNNPYFPLLKLASENLNETIENLNQVALVNISTSNSYSKINLYQIVEKNIANFATQIIDNNISINNLVSKTIDIYAIPAYANSIILNILSNAVKYRRVGIDTKITIRTKKVRNFNVLEIEDNGLGIDLIKNKDKIFGMYKTFHKGKDSRGLGLFLSKNQIEAMKGKIKIKSKVNVGTTFYIHFKND